MCALNEAHIRHEKGPSGCFLMCKVALAFGQADLQSKLINRPLTAKGWSVLPDRDAITKSFNFQVLDARAHPHTRHTLTHACV